MAVTALGAILLADRKNFWIRAPVFFEFIQKIFNKHPDIFRAFPKGGEGNMQYI